MQKFLLILLSCALLLLAVGCDRTAPTLTDTAPSVDHSVELVVRPQFVETRPPEIVEAFTMKLDKPLPPVVLHKKPPKPPDTSTSGDPNPNPAHKYAYIVGISNYEGTANDLDYCDDDAQAMKSWLQGEGFTCNMDLDLQATANNIMAGIQWLINNASPGDEVAFCYSGHGMKSSEGSAIISSDLYYIPHGYLMSYFNTIDCTKKLVTMDACVIGGFHGDVESGTYMATASNRKNSYDAPDLHHGAWTYYWLNGVENQGLVFAEEAAPYADDGMKDWAAAYRLRVDPKHSDSYSGDMDM